MLIQFPVNGKLQKSHAVYSANVIYMFSLKLEIFNQLSLVSLFDASLAYCDSTMQLFFANKSTLGVMELLPMWRRQHFQYIIFCFDI